MTRRNFIVAGITGAGALATSPLRGQDSSNPTPNVEDFFRDFTADWVRHDPNLATSARYFTGDEQDRLERQLTPQTLAWKLDRVRRARQGIAQLGKFDRSSLTQTQRISADLMEWQLNELVHEEPFLDYTFPLEQMNGANVGLVETLTVRHPVLTERDAENYVAALGEVRMRMEEAVEEARRLEARRFVPPKFILQATVKQMQGFADPSPAENPFITVFADKMAAIQSLPEAKKQQLRAGAERGVGEDIYPVWQKAIALLRTQTSKSTDDAGLWRLKGGADAYAYFLRHFTTTNLTAAELPQIGLTQVQRNEGQDD